MSQAQQQEPVLLKKEKIKRNESAHNEQYEADIAKGSDYKAAMKAAREEKVRISELMQS